MAQKRKKKVTKKKRKLNTGRIFTAGVILTILAICGVLGLASCEKYNRENQEITIELEAETLSLFVDESKGIPLKTTPSDAPLTELVYSSDNENVATVDTNGQVKGISEGKANITVKSKDGKTSKTLTVNVIESIPAIKETELPTEKETQKEEPEVTPAATERITPQKIELDFYTLKLYVGDTAKPNVTVTPENAANKDVIWSSSDKKIATVSTGGTITAISVGECTINVKCAENINATAQINVTVIEKEQPKPPAVESPTYIQGILIANKSYTLPSTYNPGVEPVALQAFDKMKADAAGLGLNIYISSSFRSYSYQSKIYNNYVAWHGKTEADRFSARPGHSEHQTGLAFDLNTITEAFGKTAEGEWVRDNCHKYGFIIRYPEGKESITGYMYEPWHIRYLGVEKATEVYNSGLTLEEFLGITSKYKD